VFIVIVVIISYYHHRDNEGSVVEGAARQTCLLTSSYGGRRKLSRERDVNSDVTETDQSRDLAGASVCRCWWSSFAARLQHAERVRVRCRHAPRRLLCARLSQHHLPVLRRRRRYITTTIIIIIIIIIIVGLNACCSLTSRLHNSLFPFFKVVQLLRANSVPVYIVINPVSVWPTYFVLPSLIPETMMLSVDSCHSFYTYVPAATLVLFQTSDHVTVISRAWSCTFSRS